MLLHRHGLGEVPGLVHVAATDDGDVVGQELEGHHIEDGREPGVDLGELHDVLGDVGEAGIAFGDEGEDPAVPGGGFLESLFFVYAWYSSSIPFFSVQLGLYPGNFVSILLKSTR